MKDLLPNCKNLYFVEIADKKSTKKKLKSLIVTNQIPKIDQKTEAEVYSSVDTSYEATLLDQSNGGIKQAALAECNQDTCSKSDQAKTEVKKVFEAEVPSKPDVKKVFEAEVPLPKADVKKAFEAEAPPKADVKKAFAAEVPIKTDVKTIFSAQVPEHKGPSH